MLITSGFNFLLFQIVGEASGKSSKTVARHYPGGTVEQLKAQSSSLAGDVYKARQVYIKLMKI